jgi:hypothetical protein
LQDQIANGHLVQDELVDGIKEDQVGGGMDDEEVVGVWGNFLNDPDVGGQFPFSYVGKVYSVFQIPHRSL